MVGLEPDRLATTPINLSINVVLPRFLVEMGKNRMRNYKRHARISGNSFVGPSCFCIAPFHCSGEFRYSGVFCAKEVEKGVNQGELTHMYHDKEFSGIFSTISG